MGSRICLPTFSSYSSWSPQNGVARKDGTIQYIYICTHRYVCIYILIYLCVYTYICTHIPHHTYNKYTTHHTHTLYTCTHAYIFMYTWATPQAHLPTDIQPVDIPFHQKRLRFCFIKQVHREHIDLVLPKALYAQKGREGGDGRDGREVGEGSTHLVR